MWRGAVEDDVVTHAAALTYQALLSIVPLMLLAMSIIGYLLADNPQAVQEWEQRLTGSIPGLEQVIGQNLEALVQARLSTGIVALVVLVWVGSSLTQTASHALGRVFGTAPRTALRRRLVALGTMALLGVVILAALAVTAFTTGLQGNPAVRLLGTGLSVAVDVGLFLATYAILTPEGGPRARSHLPGAVLMAIGWGLLSVLGTWYVVAVVARATVIYGAIGAIFGLIAILGIASRIFLYGAELTAAWKAERPTVSG